MTDKPNLAVSVTARLLHCAKESGDDYQTLLTAYCLERFLYRIGASGLRDRFEFDRATLMGAPRRTFERRRTPVPADDPIGITRAYWENPSRPAHVRTFARRAGLAVPKKPADEFTGLLHAFLSPVLEDLRQGSRREGTWHPGGPWR
jgi:hypothetical protein